jgi:flagellar protein FlbT
MAGLVIELKQNEMIIINGAAVRFRTKSRIEITGRAKFLYGKQILMPEDANTPAALIYLSIQNAYIGTGDERAKALEEAHGLIDQFKAQTKSKLANEILDKIMALADANQCYAALRLVRRVMQHEAAVLNVPNPLAE